MADVTISRDRQTPAANAGASERAPASAAQSGMRVQLKGAVAQAHGFEAQERLLAPVQRKGGADQGGVHAAAAHGISGGGGAMPFASRIQQSFGGHDISHVQAHTDSAARQGSAAMGAEAYATGSHVAFGKSPDLHTAAHEAAHIVQQQAGVQLSGGVGAVGDKYEQHADRVADAVVQGKSAAPLLSEMSGGGRGAEGGGGGVQKREAGGVQREDAAAPDITLEQALALARSMGLDKDEILERATGAKPASEPAPGRAVQRKTEGSGGGGGAVEESWLASVWSSVKSFFQGLLGPKGAAEKGGGDPTEDKAIAEDRAAFHDVDGQVGVFETREKVATYFNDTSPAAWRSAQRDHVNIMRKANEQGVSAAEVNALVGYTGPAYSPMNRMTRGQMKSNYFKDIFQGYCGLASAALGKLGDGKVKSSQRGWRTVPNGDKTIIENLYNREYVDEPGFMSTTAHSEQGMFEGPVSLQIKARSGVDIQHFSWYASEGEILFAPGTRFKVTRFQCNADVEAGWKAWHADNTQPKPGKPWFEVDLEGK